MTANKLLDIKKPTKSKTEEQSELSGSENPDDLDGLFCNWVSGEVVDHDEPKVTVQTDINCCPGELRLEYEETRYSSYSEVIMRSVSGSIKECYHQNSFIEPEILDTPLKEYCPLEMGPFHLLRVSKGNLQYLDVVSEPSEENPEIEELRQIYPQATEDGKLILHPPSQLWGFDGARLIVVVIASCHGDPNTNYIWNKDGKPHKEGSSLASICIDEPGRYYVEVFNGENKEASEQFDVVALGTASPTLLQTPESTTFSESTLMPETLPVIDSAELSLGKEIGSGAFGVVYTATWAGTPVAVKAIKVRNAKRLSSTLENEIKVHNTLRHPNIVQMMGVSYFKNSIYIVSEFIKGKNLDDILFDDTDKSCSLNDYTRLSINQQLCRAIAYLHHKKPQIIHRDIKPANVLVNTESFLTKLCDMGISKFKSSLTTTATTNTVSLPGTPQYMAPECLLSNKSGNAASDIWSLGCTLVECFNGEDLWGSELEEHTDDDPVTALRNILRAAQPPKAVSMLKDTIPAAIKLVLAKCFYFDAPKRPSAIDVLDAFNGDH